jgi:hypothetical protein
MFLGRIGKYIPAFAVICMLGIGGYYGGKTLFMVHPGTVVSSASSANPAISTKDVPESVVRQITGVVSGVAGIDQMVVLPAADGDGYSVTAEIDLGSETGSQAEISDKIQTETTKYFTQIFSDGKEVIDAEVYFLANGQIIASAGLGTKAYHELVARTGTNSFNLTVSLETMPSVTGQGENNSWFEIGKME